MCLTPVFLKAVREEAVLSRDGNFYHKEKSPSGFYRPIQSIPFACRKCLECRQARSYQWSIRCGLEAKLHAESCFATLTYKDSPGTHVKKHFQDFMKRLRKYIYPRRVSYFAVGQYGEQKGRPHYHVLLFGWCPDDIKAISRCRNSNTTSPKLSKIWSHGFVEVSRAATSKSASYACHYSNHSGEFSLMSRRPAIGVRALEPGLGSDDFYYQGKKTFFTYRDRLIRKRFGEERYQALMVKKLIKIEEKNQRVFDVTYSGNICAREALQKYYLARCYRPLH